MAFAVIVAGSINVLLAGAGAAISARLIIGSLVGVLVTTACGEWLLARARIDNLAAWLPSAFVVGAGVTSVALVGITICFGVSAQVAMIAWGAVVALAWAIWVPRISPGDGAWLDVGATLGLAALCVYFCWDTAAFLPMAAQGGALPAWTDYYLHGAVIASFGDPLAVGRGDIFLVGVQRPFYHYGPFMLPAALLPLSGLPGFGLSTAVLLPLGLLIGALGVYSFAAELAGGGIALIAVLVVALLPDASHYWMRNGFYGFHWLLFTAPGSGYALGVAMVSCSCLMYGLRSHRRGALWLAFMLLCALFFIRIHFFLLLAPAMLAVVILALLRGRVRAYLIGGLGVCLGVILAILVTSPTLRLLWVSLVEPASSIERMLRMGPPHFLLLFQRWLALPTHAFALMLGLGTMFVAALGVFAIAYPLMAASWYRARRGEAIDLLPALLCVSFLVLWLIAPTVVTGDPSEFKQRHFILLYALIAVWVSARVMQLCGVALRSTLGRFAAFAAFFAMVGATLVAGKFLQPDAPMLEYMNWATLLYDVRITPGVAQVGAYVRENSNPGDSLTMAGEPVKDELNGVLIQLVSLSDVPAYVSRTDLLARKGAGSLALGHSRVAQLDAMRQSPDWRLACETLRKNRIRWYIDGAGTPPRWDLTQKHAVLRSHGLAVYDAGSPGNGGKCGGPSN
jgi:hypothetical protein